MKTEGKFSQTYGRFEARAMLPAGRGLWPAFWLLANSHKSVGWPECGEIDVMEQMGSQPSTIRGSLNGPGYSGGTAVFATYGLTSGKTFANAYHVFVIEWSAGEIVYYVDDELYSKRVPASLPGGTDWVFDGHPFFVILNLAVGGNLPGDPDDSTPFPARMLVDFVRVYTKS
jgi:beta-glucanase (GH16 family)